MKKQQFAWILGGAWLVGMGVVASMSACSGDDTVTKDSGTKDQTSGDTATKDVVQQDQSTTDGGPNDVNTADCKTVPTQWPFLDDGGEGPFCPYQGDGSTFANCAPTEHCCIPSGTGNSTCQVGTCIFTKDASTNADFQCEQSADCIGAGMVCCENAGAQIQHDLGCTNYDFVQGQKGASCVQTTCPTGQAQLCASNAECTGGKTCFPLNTKGIWLGVCRGADGGT